MNQQDSEGITRRGFFPRATSGIVAIVELVRNLLSPATEAAEPAIKIKDFYLGLGDSNIKIRKIVGRNTGIVYWRPHSNEAIAAQALEEHIKSYGGTAYIIMPEGTTREIAFNLNGMRYSVDPNRIFTKRGREEYCRAKEGTLKYNAIEAFANECLNLLNPCPTVVAVHNNEDGYKGDGKGGQGTISIRNCYSTFSGRYPGSVHIVPSEDEDNLFWVTKKGDFDFLMKEGYNVVLEPTAWPQELKKPQDDDGSISVYFAGKSKRYFNVEVEDGGGQRPREAVLQKQLEMLRVIHQHLYHQQ